MRCSCAQADFPRANRDTSPSGDLTCEGAQVRLVRSRGGNTMECESEDGRSSLYWCFMFHSVRNEASFIITK